MTLDAVPNEARLNIKHKILVKVVVNNNCLCAFSVANEESIKINPNIIKNVIHKLILAHQLLLVRNNS